MQLCFSSLFVSNDNFPLSYDEVAKLLKVNEWVALKTEVISAMMEWFELPSVLKDNEQEQAKEVASDPKN